MHNIRLTIEYDGTDYSGWQAQRSANSKSQIANKEIRTIQGTIEEALLKILQEKVNIVAAGRTDSGVHAVGQVCNFRTSSKIAPLSIKKALNSALPKDISIKSAEYVELKFNSQIDAKSKIYRYRILARDHGAPLLRKQTYNYKFPLDLKLMKSEAKALLGRHNFKSFQAKDIVERFPRCNVKSIVITKEGDLINIDIEADRFLYNMVRNIVGTLLEVGRGYFKKGSMHIILNKLDRSLAGPTAPSHGLTLLKVKY